MPVDVDASRGPELAGPPLADRWLLVLGSSGGCPGPDRACPGYLVGLGDTRVLLDCGPGVVSHLRRVTDYAEIDAVVISHLHADHFLDLVPFAYGLMMDLVEYGTLNRIPVHVPPGGAEFIARFDALLGHGGWQISTDPREGPGYPRLAELMDEAGGLLPAVFDVREFSPRERLRIGKLTLDFAELLHTVPAFGIGVSDGVHRLAYTGDTREGPAVAAFASGADLLLCDASLSQRGCALFGGHMTAAEAGAIAAVAGVRQLVLTHVFDQDDRRSRLHDEATTTFLGLVDIAEEFTTYQWSAPADGSAVTERPGRASASGTVSR